MFLSRVIIIQPITDEILKDSKRKLYETNKSQLPTPEKTAEKKAERKLHSDAVVDDNALLLINTNSMNQAITNTNTETVLNLT